MVETSSAMILSFWALVDSSIVNNFSSVKRNFSILETACRLSSRLLLTTRFSLTWRVRKWAFFLLNDRIPNSFLTTLCKDPREIFITEAIFLTERRGFLRICSLTAFVTFLVTIDFGRPLLTLSPVLQVS